MSALTPTDVLLRVLRRPATSGNTPALEAKLAAAEALTDGQSDACDVQIVAEIAQGPQVDPRLQVRAAILLKRWGVESLPKPRDPLTFGGDS